MASSTTNVSPSDAATTTHVLPQEAYIVDSSLLLLLRPLPTTMPAGASRLLKEFCGTLLEVGDDDNDDDDEQQQRCMRDLPGLCREKKVVYLCGAVGRVGEEEWLAKALRAAKRVRLVHGLCQEADGSGSGWDERESWQRGWRRVQLGRVPIRVAGSAGVLYRRFFDSHGKYFERISGEHRFQSLVESTKPGTAHRSGAYLTPVKAVGENELHFHLLRCSTSLSGPTLNFRANDLHIVDALNEEAAVVMENAAPLNHVLAQIYHNAAATQTQKQVKARIKAHADKTKDMPVNGIIAFCTFYDGLDKLKCGQQADQQDPFEYFYKGTSGLTRLHFRLKKDCQPHNNLPSEFTVTLYPESVFMMPLSTNRLYTHEIRPSTLNAERLPTRMGYVVRCSGTLAIHKDGANHIKTADNRLVPLEEPTPDGMHQLRNLYFQENSSSDFVDYEGKFLFSMNKGDYEKPEYAMEAEFRRYEIPAQDDVFQELLASARFEDVAKGRQGAVLVHPDEERGCPIVRTTTQYRNPAQRFRDVHIRLAEEIRAAASLPAAFNNALFESYSNAYTTMGFHSDQALDLEGASFIAVFSCYKNPELPPRKLVIQSKTSAADASGSLCEIELKHNSAVVFSLDTNRRFRHKIVLDPAAAPLENQWLGVTFRTSKTFVQFRDEQVYFEDGTLLSLAANGDSEFYKLRGRENKETDFTYPRIDCSVSQSDLMPVM